MILADRFGLVALKKKVAAIESDAKGKRPC
jgi:hypothetical protein